MMVAFEFFGISVYWYGIFYFIAFVIGYCFLLFLGKKKYFASFPRVQNLLTTSLDSLMLVILFGVLFGGRLGHFLIYYPSELFQNPLVFFQVWKGGMSFIGGMIGVIFGFFILIRKYRLSWREGICLLDLVLTIVPLGILLGRFGNYLNQELYGIIFHNPGFSEGMVQFLMDVQLLHVYPHVDSALRVNTNFLAMICEGGVLLVVQLLCLRSSLCTDSFRVGERSGFFVIWYSVVRFFLEYLRNDSQAEFVGRCTKSQWFFVGFFLIGLVLFRYARRGVVRQVK